MNKKAYIFLVIIAGFWCMLILSVPILKYFGFSGYSFVINFVFSSICHQLPERSFYIFNEKLAVCYRCTSLYFSFWFGILLYPVIKKILKNRIPDRNIILFPILFICADFILGNLRIYQWMPITIFTGALFGLAASYIVVFGFIEFFESLKFREVKSGRQLPTGKK